MNGETFFQGVLVLSIAGHVVALTAHAGDDGDAEERFVQVPVVLEEEPAPEVEPPPPPPAEKKPPSRPRSLPQHIDKVVAGDGARAGELVEAEEGDYDDLIEDEPVAAAPEPEAEPLPLPPPPPPPKPKVDRVKLTRNYLQQLRSLLASRRVYPLAARRMGVEGVVMVGFTIGPDGSFSGVQVRRSSGAKVLDRAALQTVQSLSGSLPRPPAIGDTPLRTSVALRYQYDS